MRPPPLSRAPRTPNGYPRLVLAALDSWGYCQAKRWEGLATLLAKLLTPCRRKEQRAERSPQSRPKCRVAWRAQGGRWHVNDANCAPALEEEAGDDAQRLLKAALGCVRIDAKVDSNQVEVHTAKVEF